MVEFWQAVPGHGFGLQSEDWRRLDEPYGRVNISFQVMPDPPLEKHKLHLDLYTTDQRGEVERLLALGATLYRRAQSGDGFVVLKDPAGNQFCGIDKR